MVIRFCLEESPGKESNDYGNEEGKRIWRGAESQSIVLSRSETNSTTIQRISGTEIEKMIFELWSLISPEVMLVYFSLCIANLAKFIKLQKEILSVWSQLGIPSRCFLPPLPSHLGTLTSYLCFTESFRILQNSQSIKVKHFSYLHSCLHFHPNIRTPSYPSLISEFPTQCSWQRSKLSSLRDHLLLVTSIF